MARSTKMPTELMILGRRFKISHVDSIDEGESYGEMSEDRLEIQVSKGQEPDNERDTLLHETVHAIEHVLLLKMREKQVALLATGLLQVMRENPQLVSYLCAKRAADKPPVVVAPKIDPTSQEQK